jgi:hypothetical protein
MFSNTNQIADSEVITSVVIRHRFDIDPDQTPDPDPDPDSDSASSFTYAGRSEKLLDFYSQQCQRLIFLSVSHVSKF